MELPGELPNRWTAASRERSRAATSPSMPAGQGSGTGSWLGLTAIRRGRVQARRAPLDLPSSCSAPQLASCSCPQAVAFDAC